MKKIKFIKAGAYKDTDRVFLTSRNRRHCNRAEFHANSLQTEFYFPVDFFRKNFRYNRASGIYENNLTMKDVQQFVEVAKTPEGAYI